MHIEATEWHDLGKLFLVMKPFHRLSPASPLILGTVLFLASCPLRAENNAANVSGIEAVASKVSSDYHRNKLPDGSFQPETYAFGEGGKWAGEISDITIDKLKFIDVARVISAPLAQKKYIPARDPNATSLLIMLYWGTTAVPEPYSDSMAYHEFNDAAANLAKYTVTLPSGRQITGSGPLADAALSQWSAAAHMLMMVNHQRDRTDYSNALMLGYDSPGLIGTERGNYVRGTAWAVDRDDLYDDIEANRYFIVLMAYDFPLLWKHKKHKLLWETRFSIREQNNQFDKALPAMAQYASKYFGVSSDGLVRERLPQGNVEVGTPSLIEFLPSEKK
jgi:hypothetical protein